MRRILMIIFACLALLLVATAAWLYAPDKDRASLEATYAQPPSRFLNILGLRLHVRDTGPLTPTTPPRSPVILLHGFGVSLHGWEDWARLLEPSRRVIRYDQPGFGLTGADPSGDYSDERSLAVLTALMDQLGIDRADIVGNSMGGRIAWRFAAAHPERVHRLVLMAPDGFASPGLAYGVAPKIPLMVRALPYVLPSALLRMSLAPAYADPTAMTPARLERTRDMLLAPGTRAAIVARAGQTILIDPVPLLARITTPTLLLWGEQDRMVPITNAADYLVHLPNARLVHLPATGHLPHEEQPQASLAPMQSFLDQAD